MHETLAWKCIVDEPPMADEIMNLRTLLGTTRINVSADGEVSIMDARLHYRIRPHALEVIVPDSGTRRGPFAVAR
jgi:hypothetical protein